jgi:hypothetical protein
MGSLAVDLLPPTGETAGAVSDTAAALKEARGLLVKAAGNKGGASAQRRAGSAAAAAGPLSKRRAATAEAVEEPFEKKFSKLPWEEQLRKAGYMMDIALPHSVRFPVNIIPQFHLCLPPYSVFPCLAF